MRGRLEAEDVRAALAGCVIDILDRFGAEYRNGRNITLRECPACKARPRRPAIKVLRDTGRWIHHSGPAAACKGDVLDLFGAFEGLDRSRFPELLERAAAFAGITADTDAAELARIRAEYQARREARARRAAEQRAAAEARVPALWAALARRHPRGERYLDERGLEPAALCARGDLVRYYPDGAPAVLRHDLATGAPINIARRQIDREPKVCALSIARELGLDEHEVDGSFSTTGSLAGRIESVCTIGQGSDIAIIVEGVTDTLASLLVFPGCVVLGANGWRQMPRVAAAVAPRLVETRGWLLVAVDVTIRALSARVTRCTPPPRPGSNSARACVRSSSARTRISPMHGAPGGDGRGLMTRPLLGVQRERRRADRRRASHGAGRGVRASRAEDRGR